MWTTGCTVCARKKWWDATGREGSIRSRETAGAACRFSFSLYPLRRQVLPASTSGHREGFLLTRGTLLMQMNYSVTRDPLQTELLVTRALSRVAESCLQEVSASGPLRAPIQCVWGDGTEWLRRAASVLTPRTGPLFIGGAISRKPRSSNRTAGGHRASTSGRRSGARPRRAPTGSPAIVPGPGRSRAGGSRGPGTPQRRSRPALLQAQGVLPPSPTRC